ncbi:hypothetical protein [Geodermatophilus sp. SYSU D01105]
MSVENRLTADQLAALEPGDTVTIESEVSIGRPRHAAGTVARVTGPDILVNVKSRRGLTHQERYRRRDGTRIGGVSRAELVNADDIERGATPVERQQVQRIHGLYRTWIRNRGDVEALRELHAAIGDYLIANEPQRHKC